MLFKHLHGDLSYTFLYVKEKKSFRNTMNSLGEFYEAGSQHFLYIMNKKKFFVFIILVEVSVIIPIVGTIRNTVFKLIWFLDFK